MNLAAGPQGDAFDALAAHTLTAAIKGIPPSGGEDRAGRRRAAGLEPAAGRSALSPGRAQPICAGA